MPNIAMRLRERRLELGYSVSELAKLSHVQHSVVSRLESGDCMHSKYVFDIADALQVNVDWLVRGRMPVRREIQRQPA